MVWNFTRSARREDDPIRLTNGMTLHKPPTLWTDLTGGFIFDDGLLNKRQRGRGTEIVNIAANILNITLTHLPPVLFVCSDLRHLLPVMTF